MLAAAVAAGATRHVAAAVAAALMRVLLEEPPEEEAAEVDAEVSLRQRAGRPALRARVAGAEAPSGRDRASRNVAEHAHLGCGVAELQRLLEAPQSSQRGGRRRLAASALPAADFKLNATLTIALEICATTVTWPRPSSSTTT